MAPCVVIGEMAADFLRRENDSRDWPERQTLGTDSNAESVLGS